jgi:prepilin-type N-terminal cleavage/methylation domain-containing protein
MFIARDNHEIADGGLRIADGIASRRTKQSRGFTLLEITLAVAILGLMTMAIYRFVQSNMIAIRVSSEANTADARYGGLRDLLTAQWQTLSPRTGALMGEPLKLGDRPRDEIRWICSAGPGLLTRYAPGDYTVAMRLQPPDKKSNRLDLGFLRKPKDDPAITNEHESWIPLIENVQSLQIRYFDPRLNTWLDRWSDTMTLPRLVKITVGRKDASVPWEVIIALGRTPL